jgi:teichuronic acid biosynthesis glycosyltransferase TuaC
VATLSTLFPNTSQPAVGVFVENQTLRLAASGNVELRVLNPVSVPPFPLNRHPRFRGLRELPFEEDWKGIRVAHPRLRSLPGLSGRLNPALLVRCALPVLRRWRSSGFNFDVIDAEFFYPDGPAAARLAAIFDAPFSIKARGSDIHYWGAMPECRRQILRAAARANGLLAVSESLRQDMIAMGMQPDKIRVHYTGVDLDHFRPMDRQTGKAALGVSTKLVVSLGALIPRKGHDIVIEAVANLPDVTLLIVGEGPERSRLTKLTRSLGLTERVRLPGGVPHAELPAILAAADVMALASASEGLANAWVEAMACGTPVVTPDIDGAREAVAHPSAGLLVPERTAAAFSGAIRALLDNPPSQEAVRANAGRFAWRHNTLTLREHLGSLKREHGASPGCARDPPRC